MVRSVALAALLLLAPAPPARGQRLEFPEARPKAGEPAADWLIYEGDDGRLKLARDGDVWGERRFGSLPAVAGWEGQASSVAIAEDAGGLTVTINRDYGGSTSPYWYTMVIRQTPAVCVASFARTGGPEAAAHEEIHAAETWAGLVAAQPWLRNWLDLAVSRIAHPGPVRTAAWLRAAWGDTPASEAADARLMPLLAQLSADEFLTREKATWAIAADAELLGALRRWYERHEDAIPETVLRAELALSAVPRVTGGVAAKVRSK